MFILNYQINFVVIINSKKKCTNLIIKLKFLIIVFLVKSGKKRKV